MFSGRLFDIYATKNDKVSNNFHNGVTLMYREGEGLIEEWTEWGSSQTLDPITKGDFLTL